MKMLGAEQNRLTLRKSESRAFLLFGYAIEAETQAKGREFLAEFCFRGFFFDRHPFVAYRLTHSSGGGTGAGPWASQTLMMRRASSSTVRHRYGV